MKNGHALSELSAVKEEGNVEEKRKTKEEQGT